MQKYAVYWPEGRAASQYSVFIGQKMSLTMRHARGQKLQSFRRKWPFYMDLYSMIILNSDTFVHAPCGNQLRLTGLACLNKVFYLSI
jgi:hypothetical protein